MRLILDYKDWTAASLNSLNENDGLTFDWKGKSSGQIGAIFNGQIITGIFEKPGKPGAMEMQLGSAAKRGLAWKTLTPPSQTVTVPEPKKTPPQQLPSVDLSGADFPFPDNIITPNWPTAPAAKAKFDMLITNLVDYFTASPEKAKQNFGGIAIEGAADIANATLDIPAGYTKLDHNYGGGKPNNEFLAQNRALKTKEEIIKAITGKLSPELVAFITEKITTSFKTGLPRGGRYVKIVPSAKPYEIEVASTEKPAEAPVTTDTPGSQEKGAEVSKTYSVLSDSMLEYFFGSAKDHKIESSAIRPFRPDSKGNSDFVAIKLDALQAWAKEYLGGELLTTPELESLTATVEKAGEGISIKFGAPTGKVLAPTSGMNNSQNSIIASEANSQALVRSGRGLDQQGILTGFPFIVYVDLLGNGTEGILRMSTVTISPEMPR